MVSKRSAIFYSVGLVRILNTVQNYIDALDKDAATTIADGTVLRSIIRGVFQFLACSKIRVWFGNACICICFCCCAAYTYSFSFL